MRRVLAVAALAIAAGCGEAETVRPAPLDAGRVGASIAVLAGGEVAVVNPDQGSVSLLDPVTLAPRVTVAVGGEPRALLELRSGAILVTTYRGGEAAVIDPASGQVTAHRAVCAGPWGLAEAPDGVSVVVACEWEGTVLRLDPATLAATPVARGLSRPRAVATVGGDVWVAEFTGGAVRRIDAQGVVSAIPLTPAEAPYRPALTAMTANLAAALLPAFGRVHVVHELVNHRGDSSAEKVADDYGSVVDGNPKINPAVSSLDPGSGRALGAAEPPPIYARYDGGPRVFNGPTALAAFGDRYLLVAHLSTADVAVLDTVASTPDERVVESFAAGAGPSGVAVDGRGALGLRRQRPRRLGLAPRSPAPAVTFGAALPRRSHRGAPPSVALLARGAGGPQALPRRHQPARHALGGDRLQHLPPGRRRRRPGVVHPHLQHPAQAPPHAAPGQRTRRDGPVPLGRPVPHHPRSGRGHAHRPDGRRRAAGRCRVGERLPRRDRGAPTAAQGRRGRLGSRGRRLRVELGRLRDLPRRSGAHRRRLLRRARADEPARGRCLHPGEHAGAARPLSSGPPTSTTGGLPRCATCSPARTRPCTAAWARSRRAISRI